MKRSRAVSRRRALKGMGAAALAGSAAGGLSCSPDFPAESGFKHKGIGRTGMEQRTRTVLDPEAVMSPGGEYSSGIKVAAGTLIFVAGQTAMDPQGVLVGEGDAAAQTRQAFRNIGHVLESAGASFSHVVEFTTYLVGIESVRPFLEARAELFRELYPDGDYPTNTLLNIHSLAGSKALVEIKAIAVLPE